MSERKRNRALGVVFTFVAATSALPSAYADDRPPPPAPQAEPPRADASARAAALFQEGRKLFEQGRFDEACARLAQSDAIDPTVSTLGLLAGCHEQQGRVATAWREYLGTAQRAEAAGDSRAEFARQRAAALAPALPKLLIRLNNPSPDLQIFRNLERVPPEELGAEVPVDPGAYEIVARGPQRQEFRVTVTAKEGTRVSIDVPDILVAPGEAPKGAPPPASKPPPAVAMPKDALAPRPQPQQVVVAPAPGLDGRTKAAIAAGAVGLTGMSLGIMFGMSAVSQNVESRTIQVTCKTPAECDDGRRLREGAYASSTASTVSFGVGMAGVGVGLILVLLPNTKSQPVNPRSTGIVQFIPSAGPRGGGAALLGRF